MGDEAEKFPHDEPLTDGAPEAQVSSAENIPKHEGSTHIPRRFIRAAKLGKYTLPEAGAVVAIIGEVTNHPNGSVAGAAIFLAGIGCSFYPETKPAAHPHHKKMGFWGFIDFFVKPPNSGPGHSSGMV